MRYRKQSRGFTVIELLAVISIIAILLTFVVPMGNKAKTKARIAKAKTEIAALETAISAYYTDMGTYPTDRTAADQLENRNTVIITRLSGRNGGTGSYDMTIVNDSNWNGPYMEFDAASIASSAFIDPWGNPYVIEIALDNDVGTPPTHNALSFDISSNGPNETAGDSDDITNY